MPGRASRAPRAPFVVLVLMVLGVGLIGLLVLNTALQQGSFELGELQTRTDELRDQRTALADDVAARSAPDALAERATRLGMVSAETPPLFLEVGSAGVAGETSLEVGSAGVAGETSLEVGSAGVAGETSRDLPGSADAGGAG